MTVQRLRVGPAPTAGVVFRRKLFHFHTDHQGVEINRQIVQPSNIKRDHIEFLWHNLKSLRAGIILLLYITILGGLTPLISSILRAIIIMYQ
jgi:hypothetical protein